MGFVFPSFISDAKNRITRIEREMGDLDNRNVARRRINSYKKHLGVERLSGCDDYKKLLAYECHLKERGAN